jgi:hypothetical protein
MQTTLDWAPVVVGESTVDRDARLAQADVVWACYSLQGANVTTVSQLITTEAFPSNLNTLAWWKARVPTLSEYADSDITLTGATRLGDSSLANILITGDKQPWMNITVEKERVRVNLAFIKRGTVGGVSTIIEQGTKSITLELQVTGAPVGETLYRTPASVDAGEPVPSGIAAQLYAEWAQLHYQGTIVFKDDDVPGDCLPGKALNLTGGRDEWTSMAAMIIRCSENVDSGETTVEFGIPDWTDVDSRVAFDRATRTRNPADSRVWRTGLTSNGVTGSNATVLQRDGNVGAGYVRQLYVGTASPYHTILIDADALTKSTEGTTLSALAPREMYLPYLDAADGYRVKAKLAQVIASALYGTAVPLAQANPDIPSAYDWTPGFWGEYSGASGGGTTPSTFGWVASGVTGHTGNGFQITLVTRTYIDNAAATPNLYSEQVSLLFAADGRLLACTVPWSYTISATVAV